MTTWNKLHTFGVGAMVVAGAPEDPELSLDAPGQRVITSRVLVTNLQDSDGDNCSAQDAPRAVVGVLLPLRPDRAPDWLWFYTFNVIEVMYAGDLDAVGSVDDPSPEELNQMLTPAEEYYRTKRAH